MTPDPWKKAEELYHAALERAPSERDAFLEKACGGDEALLDEVKSRLGGFWVGRRVQSYEVLSLLGTGGMGEVYRAKDTKLGREVALKVLSEEFARDPERVTRFEREARLLAALNHPNVAAIHGLEESEGRHVLVLELVEGETLAERIARGPIPLAEALPLFRQIAAGLEAAHEKGIIHRDLKPANVRITPEGQAKVLDFGLAKSFPGVVAAESDLDTRSAPDSQTGEGRILGTVAYMSPEQARGQAVDKRTDVWAFGCVLYEALTGRRAFAGGTMSDTFAAVLDREVDWERLPAGTPAGLRSLLRRCLQKDRDRRLHDIADARIEIEEVLSEPRQEPELHPRAGTAKRVRALPIVVSAAAAALLASLAVWGLLRRSVPEARPVTQFTIDLDETGLEDPLGFSGPGRRFCLSPDGRQLVFVAGSQLYLRQMARLDSEPIPGTEGAHHPFFSPDGQWLGFFAGGQLRKLSLETGAQLTLCESGTNPWGASWGPDGIIIFASAASGLRRISAEGGTPGVVTTLEPGDPTHRFPEILPSGEGVLFTIWGAQPSIAVLSLATGERRILVEGGQNPLYVSTGHIAYGRGRALHAVPFDVQSMELTGLPVTVLDDVWVRGAGGAMFSFSNDGSLVYQPAADPELDLLWVDRTGLESPLSEVRRAFDAPRLSPDGQLLATMVDVPPHNIWVLDIARGAFTRVTFGTGDNHGPIWTPDGRRLTFTASPLGHRYLAWKSADGSGAVERVATSDHPLNTGSWSPDGRMLAFEEVHPDTGHDIWVFESDGERHQTPLLSANFDERHPVFSPDGRWLAYTSDESGRDEVYVRSFPASGAKRQVSVEGGVEPVWNPMGGELFFRSGNRIMGVTIRTEPVLTLSRPRMLFDGPYKWSSSAFGARNYDVAPDGQRFVVLTAPAAPARLHIILNWFEELERLAPTD
jgi:serine/threonine protein kinase/Tol biopolymer transport system component